MEILIKILKILLAAILLIIGFASIKAYKSTGIELRLFGSQHYATGYKRRRLLLFIFGYGFMILSFYLFYTIIFDI